MKSLEKVFDILGEILAVIMVITFMLLLTNATFDYIPSGIFLSILNGIRLYGGIALVLIVGAEAIVKRNFVFKIIFLLCAAVIIIFMFFPDTYNSLVGLIS